MPFLLLFAYELALLVAIVRYAPHGPLRSGMLAGWVVSVMANHLFLVVGAP